MGKTIRNYSVKKSKKMNKNLLVKRSDNGAKWIRKSTLGNERDVELLVDHFELQSPKVQIDYSNPYQRPDLGYDIADWE